MSQMGIVAVFVSAALAGDANLADSTSRPQIEIEFRLSDLNGKVHELNQNDTSEIRAFVFLSTTCPIANSYTQELNRLAESAPEGVQLLGVVSDPSVSRADAVAHFEEFETSFPILFDTSGLLASVLQPTHVPEAFVIDAEGHLAYRGAIDNAYASIGRRRISVEEHYLEQALVAIAAGEQPEPSQTRPVGCHFPQRRTVFENAAVTYTRDVAPIIQTRCMTCHRSGQVAPFSLTNHQETSQHAEMIVEVTQRRIMPPWMPGPESQSEFVGER